MIAKSSNNVSEKCILQRILTRFKHFHLLCTCKSIEILHIQFNYREGFFCSINSTCAALRYDAYPSHVLIIRT